jgi:hypothetical protein
VAFGLQLRLGSVKKHTPLETELKRIFERGLLLSALVSSSCHAQ